jgi:hypothetical protein
MFNNLANLEYLGELEFTVATNEPEQFQAEAEAHDSSIQNGADKLAIRNEATPLLLNPVPQPTELSSQEEVPESISEYDEILKEIKEDEAKLEASVEATKDVTQGMQKKLMHFLKDDTKPNVICADWLSEAISAYARLTSITVDGRYKLATLKRQRAAIIKDRNTSSADNGFDLSSILND